MQIEINWVRQTFGETENRVYRDTVPMDPAALPVPIATLGQGVTTWTDTTVVDNETYHYRIASLYQGQEYVSTELTVLADPLAVQA